MFSSLTLTKIYGKILNCIRFALAANASSFVGVFYKKRPVL